MKKSLLLLLFCISFVSSQAQMENLRLGITLEPFSPSWMSSNSPTIVADGWNFSRSAYIKAEFHLSPFISIATGLGITANQGGKLVYTNGGDVWSDSELVPTTLHNLPPGASLRSKIQYIELPAAFKMRTQEFSNFRVFFEVPRLTLGITSQAKGNVVATDIDVENQNIYPSMSWLNVSYGLMTGIEYSLTEDISAIVGLHWKQGFVDVTDDSGVDAKITSGSFGLQVGVLF